jgi:cyclase
VTGTVTGAPGLFEGGLRVVGDGVRAWLQPNGSWGETNAGLVSDGGMSLLVDSLWDPRLTERMLASMAPTLAHAPITTAVNTHRDGDHWWGNALLPGQTRIVASATAAEEMAVEPPPASLARLSALARLGTRLPGAAGRLSRYTRDMLGPFGFRGVTTRQPTETFSGTATLHVGARQVHLVEVGPAHTAGDAVVHVPDAGVVFCGDILFVGVTPGVWHGPVANWVRALDRCLAMDADTYVPGHGALGTRADVVALREYFTWLIEAGAEQHAAGRDVQRAARALTGRPEFARWRDWQCPERLALNLIAYFRELDGQAPSATTSRNRALVFRHVADLHGALN